MEGNITWKRNRHWRIELLIATEPVLEVNSLTDALAQETILSNEITHITYLEENKENVKSWSSYKRYKKELELAILSMQRRA